MSACARSVRRPGSPGPAPTRWTCPRRARSASMRERGARGAPRSMTRSAHAIAAGNALAAARRARTGRERRQDWKAYDARATRLSPGRRSGAGNVHARELTYRPDGRTVRPERRTKGGPQDARAALPPAVHEDRRADRGPAGADAARDARPRSRPARSRSGPRSRARSAPTTSSSRRRSTRPRPTCRPRRCSTRSPTRSTCASRSTRTARSGRRRRSTRARRRPVGHRLLRQHAARRRGRARQEARVHEARDGRGGAARHGRRVRVRRAATRSARWTRTSSTSPSGSCRS